MFEIVIYLILSLTCLNAYFLATENQVLKTFTWKVLGKLDMWSSCCFSLVVHEIKDGITRGFPVLLHFTVCIDTVYGFSYI